MYAISIPISIAGSKSLGFSLVDNKIVARDVANTYTFRFTMSSSCF